MGYDYTVQGWCKLKRPVDLATIELPPVGHVVFDDQHAPWDWARVTGRRSDHLLFATEAKHVGNYYVGLVSSLQAACGGGTGVITVTGEIMYDGKGRIIVADGLETFTLPTRRWSDAGSPWGEVFASSSYMRREPDRLPEVNPARLRSDLSGRSDVNGWLLLAGDRYRDGQWVGSDRAAAVAEQLAGWVPALADGTAWMSHYSEPYVLVGQDDVDAAEVVAAMARTTAEHPESYGMLYCGTSDDGDRTQVPVILEAGRSRVLPAVSLALADEPDAGPARADAYEGLDSGFAMCLVRWAGDIHSLYAAMRRVLPTDATAADDEGRPSGPGLPAYRFTAGLLTFDLTHNDGNQWPRSDPVAWPFTLDAMMRHEADPIRLRRAFAEVAARLATVGIEAGPNLIEPDQRGDLRT